MTNIDCPMCKTREYLKQEFNKTWEEYCFVSDLLDKLNKNSELPWVRQKNFEYYCPELSKYTGKLKRLSRKIAKLS